MIIKIRRLNYKKSKDNDYKDRFEELSANTIKQIVGATQSVYIKKQDRYVDLKEQAIRLCYYYRHNYLEDYGYSSPSYSSIVNDIGIRNEDIKIINNVLKKNKIIEVYIGDWMENEEGSRIRERNRYCLLLN